MSGGFFILDKIPAVCFLNANFFKSIVDKKAKFLNGPLANIVFEILENNKNNLIIKINQKKVKIQNQFKIYYIPA